jgi:S1-C subfamily serine protease
MRAAPRAARRRRAVALLALPAVAMTALATGLIWPSAPSPEIEALRVASGNGIATGFPVADGRVVTVAHVLDGPVTVRGRRVRVLRIDRRNDLALLSVPGLRAAAPDIASAANDEHLRVVRVRDGAPSLLSVHVRRSIVAHVRAAGSARAFARPALELSALEGHGHAASGDSGAPVITDSGAVAGVIFAASRNRADTAYAVEAGQLRRLSR